MSRERARRGAINRFNRRAKAGTWLRIFDALAQAFAVHAHQHAAGGKKRARITPLVVLVEALGHQDPIQSSMLPGNGYLD